MFIDSHHTVFIFHNWFYLLDVPLRRQYDPVIIERTIGFVLGPSTTLYKPFLKHYTLTNKAVGLYNGPWPNLFRGKRVLIPSPLSVSRDSYSPWTLARIQTARNKACSSGCHYIILIYEIFMCAISKLVNPAKDSRCIIDGITEASKGCWFDTTVRHYFSQNIVCLLTHCFTAEEPQSESTKREEENRVYWFEIRV